MSMRNRNPGYPRQSDQPLKKAMTRFIGMLSGEPASELPDGYSALNRNVIDRGEYYDVRSGSSKYTSFKLGYKVSSVSLVDDEITTENVHRWLIGDVLYFSGLNLPSPFVEGTGYYVIKTASNKLKLAATYSNSMAGTVINITDVGAGSIYLYYGEINAVCDHSGQNKLVIMLGKSVYVANKSMNVFTKVLNCHSVDPDGVSTMVEYDNDVILFSATGGIFKIIISDGFYRMYKINIATPSVIVFDVNESLPATKYGYLYTYGMVIIDGTGNRDRLAGDEILFESGTSQDGSSKDYGECYYTTEVGMSLSDVHSIGVLTLPDEAVGVTHFSIYRSRQIGENSGGSSTSVDSIGNKRDFMLWIADAPVAKAFVINTSVAGTGTIASGNKYVLGDVTNILKDTSGNTGTINAYTNENSVTLSAGLASGTTIYCAIGGGRVMRASQSGNTLTKNLGNDFAILDKGLQIFLSDGTYRTVVKYVSASAVEVAETGDFTNFAITIKPLTGNFARRWNDTIPDDPQGDGKLSWEDIELYSSDICVPRRFFKPLPNADIGVIDNGFVVTAIRGLSKYYYSQIGDKTYSMGYYKHPVQYKKIAGAISHIVVFPSRVVILTYNKTGVLILSSSGNVGRTSVGENVYELPAMSVIDTERGVRAWQTVKFKNSNLMYALTSDSAYRSFDGSSWSIDDAAIINGRDAVSSKYFKLADQSEGINAFYSNSDGMKIWLQRWNEKTAVATAVYKAIQCTLNEEDANMQLCFDTRETRGSGLSDIEMLIL